MSEGGPSDHWGPYINILQGVKTLLATLKESFQGPLGGVGGALDVVSVRSLRGCLGEATGWCGWWLSF